MVKVSVVIPMLNEEKYIRQCLESILLGSYDLTKIEILVFDGGSGDHSKSIVQDIAKSYPVVQLFDNPKRVQVSALNMGIRQAQGEIFIRLDAHCTYQNDYIEKCVYFLENYDAKNVGGLQFPVGSSYVTRGIATALASRLGNGGADYRIANSPVYSDTVFLGCWHKKTLIELGGFNEQMEINEDYELNIRLRNSGGKILVVPSIVTSYHVRSSYTKLFKQYFKYGRWKFVTLRNYPSTLKLRQFMVPVAVLILIFSSVASLFSQNPLWLLPLAGYLTLSTITAILINVSKRSVYETFSTSITYPVLHFSWGLGFILSIFLPPVPREK